MHRLRHRAEQCPPYAGPAAAIAAGLAALERDRAALERDRAALERDRAGDARRALAAPYTLVLACDMPRADAAVQALLHAAAAAPPGDGFVAVSADGRRQPLTGLYGTAALQRCTAEATERGALENASVFALLARLEVREVSVPEGSTDDVDTWDDASALGVTRPPDRHGSDRREHESHEHDRREHDSHGRASIDPGVRPGTPQLNSTLEANGEKPG